MKEGGITKSRVISIAICLLMITSISASITQNAGESQNVGKTTLNSEIQVISNSADQIAPAIFNDIVVWQDNRNSNWDIYLYDFMTDNETQITNNTADQVRPKIFGDYVVWADRRNTHNPSKENWDIYMYQISTGIESPITLESGNQESANIFEDYIVWQDMRNGNWDIYLHEISTGNTMQITTDLNNQYWVEIYRDFLVWTDDRFGNTNRDIFMYEICTGNETRLNSNSTDQIEAVIWGDHVIWEENSDIYLSQINTGYGEFIVSANFEQGDPDIYGDYVVWRDNRDWLSGFDDDIYLYKISTNEEISVIKHKGKQNFPNIHNNTIVWQDNRNGNWDIYLRVIESEQPDIPPVANSGIDQTLYEDDLVFFDGTSSFDQDGNSLYYSWDFDSNDGLWWETGANPDATDPTPTHTYGDDGVFVATLRVTDDDNLTGLDTCNVTVQNVDPTVTIESITMNVEIGLRVAGRKYNNVSMTLYEEGSQLGYVSIERIPGSPDEQMGWIPVSINFSKFYSATVTYTPEDPPNVGGNPVWIYIKSQNGSIKKIHHTFNVQQSKKRDSEHWNHVEPWEVDLNGHFIGLPFEITSHITDPGSDDEILTFTYGSQVKIVPYLNNPLNPDPYPSPEVNPVDITDTTTLIYEGPGTVTLVVKDDDNIRLGVGEGTDSLDVG